MVYGMIGVGAIAAAIVTGLCDGIAEAPEVLLSPRNARLAADLAARFPNTRVCGDNQAVVDGADVIVLCLRPRDAEAVLGGLAFRPGQAVVSAMAGVPFERLAPLVVPAQDIARAIPLTAVARRQGITPIHPGTKAARALFAPLGGVLVPPDIAAFEVLSAASGTIAAHFATLGAITRWLTVHGIPEAESTRHVASVYPALAGSLRDGCSFAELAAEFTTPGGLNALFRAHLDEAGAFDAVATGLDRVLAQLTGGTPGSQA